MSRPVCVSPLIADIAAAGYMLLSELEHPSPDWVMRREYQRRLSELVQSLTVDQRTWLKKRADSGTVPASRGAHTAHQETTR